MIVETREVLITVDQLERAVRFNLADAVRAASELDGISQCVGWGDGQNNACALTGAFLSARKRGYL